MEHLWLLAPAALTLTMVLLAGRHLAWRWRTRGIVGRRRWPAGWLPGRRRDPRMERRIGRIGGLPAAEDDTQDRAA